MCGCKATYKHHRLLHRRISPRDNTRNQSKDQESSRNNQKESERPEQTLGGEPSKPDIGNSRQPKTTSYVTMTERKENHVLLHVTPVKVSTKDENSVTTYGLLDNASRGTIVDVNLAKRLNVKGIKQTVAVMTVLGTQNCEFESVCLSPSAGSEGRIGQGAEYKRKSSPERN